ncbi:hypothetical protein CAEBREN_03027 [Caenorhabditis brenneri]|uniref:F-box domain-containing protein n=1 Tax=Caenorhabditis brenneri TaxID=135651 RepID=G0P3Y9_CAEBE|nr:hypothetical protein CAEBREN_03027 [Caenorhabditis brenneri]
MKLINFPHLVQAEIYKLMNYGDVFIFSLTSKKCTQSIENVRFKEIYLIRINTDAMRNTVKATVVFQNGEEQQIVELCPSLRFYEKEIKNITIFGQKTEYRYRNHRTYYPSASRQELTYFLYNQLHRLFGKHTIFEFVMTGKWDCLPIIPNIKRSIMNSLENTPAEYLDDYFKALPAQEIVKISMKRLYGNLSPNSKLYEAQNLKISCNFMSPDILFNFKGKTAILTGVHYTKEDICQFLKNWKSKTSGINLHRLNVFIDKGFDDFESINQIVDTKKITVGVPEELLNHQGETFDSYIVRADGIVAWLVISRIKISLHVQDFTEEEMLKKYNIDH